MPERRSSRPDARRRPRRMMCRAASNAARAHLPTRCCDRRSSARRSASFPFGPTAARARAHPRRPTATLRRCYRKPHFGLPAAHVAPIQAKRSAWLAADPRANALDRRTSRSRESVCPQRQTVCGSVSRRRLQRCRVRNRNLPSSAWPEVRRASSKQTTAASARRSPRPGCRIVALPRREARCQLFGSSDESGWSRSMPSLNIAATASRESSAFAISK